MYYIGQSNDVEARLKRHNRGESSSTKRGIPWKLRWEKKFNTRSEAMAMEKKLKGMKSRRRIEDFIRGYQIEDGI